MFQIVYFGNHFDHPYGLAYFNDFLYWTEFQNGTINKLNLKDKSVETLGFENPPLFELRVFSNDSQTGKVFLYLCLVALSRCDSNNIIVCCVAAESGCSKNNGGCEELCLSTPEGIECACQDSFMLVDNKCVFDSSMFVSTKQTNRECTVVTLLFLLLLLNRFRPCVLRASSNVSRADVVSTKSSSVTVTMIVMMVQTKTPGLAVLVVCIVQLQYIIFFTLRLCFC
jgi:hypothetical protein